MFSYWGGTYYTDERFYLFLKFSDFGEQAQIDFQGHQGTKADTLAYVENITYYKDQAEVNKIADAHDAIQLNKFFLSKQQNARAARDLIDKCASTVGFAGLQWKIDRQCFSSVIRETINSDPYSCVTEKTLRCFLHHCVALPMGYRAVQDLEQHGFWFPHDLIDYSYQHIDIFYHRVTGLKSQIRHLAKKSMRELQNYYVDNIEHFLYNSKLVTNLVMQSQIDQN